LCSVLDDGGLGLGGTVVVVKINRAVIAEKNKKKNKNRQNDVVESPVIRFRYATRLKKISMR